jgi:hypothetical protein
VTVVRPRLGSVALTAFGSTTNAQALSLSSVCGRRNFALKRDGVLTRVIRIQP